MNSESFKEKMRFSAYLGLRQFVVYCRANTRAIAKAVALMAVILELGGIWHEVHQMQREQVKNALYALPMERRNTLAARRLDSSSFVRVEVAINGTVQLDEPVTVEIDR